MFVQKQLLNLGSIISFDGTKKSIKLPQLLIDDIQKIEKEIDLIEERLPQLTQFILPAGHPISSLCHIAEQYVEDQKEELFFCLIKQKNMKMQFNFLIDFRIICLFYLRVVLLENNKSEIYWK